MEKDIKILIVPDVHGRSFWREPIMQNLDKEIVFLGDYLDPYPQEGITPWQAIPVLEEIIDLRREHPNITLLLGNHDGGYCLSPRVCECRHDWENASQIHKMFEENFNFFDIAKETTINKKRFFFSHAGINPAWIKYDTYAFPHGFKPTAKKLNEMLHTNNAADLRSFISALADVSFYRGGYESYGSMIWADIREFYQNKEIAKKKTIQVVGHTMLNGKAVRLGNNFYCLDCQQVFYIDSQGIIRYYNTDEEVQEVG